MKIFLQYLADRSKQGRHRTGADAGKLAKRRPGFGRQATEFADHEIDHVVGVALGVDVIEIPGPSRICMIENQ
jgi:hypothetical protein